MYIHKDVDIVTLCCQIRMISEFVNVPPHFPNLVAVKRNQFLVLQREMITARRTHRQQQARAFYSSSVA